MPQFIHSAQDLLTSHEATRNGFLEQAFRKAQAANPYIAQAHKLRYELQQSAEPRNVVNNPRIQYELVAAAGFSDKAANYFSTQELRDALLKVLEVIHEQASTDWREEILYRFLLTRGDSLGGTMRNTTGASAQMKFVDAILEALARKGVSPSVQR
ncbi:MAG: AvaI/BsoBI family type II restriction endonuclease, partial [Chloroflexota bacterium]